MDESTSSLNAVRRKEVKLQIHTRMEPCTPDWFSVITSLASSRALMCREVDESGSSKSAAISFKDRGVFFSMFSIFRRTGEESAFPIRVIQSWWAGSPRYSEMFRS